VDAEGNFGTLITKSKITNKVVTRNRLSISQSTHDYFVLVAIKEFFKAGNLNPKQEDMNSLDKAKLCNINSFYYNSSPQTIISFFDEYPMYTQKYLDYLDFKNFYQLKKDKVYITDKGFEEMLNVALNMNSGRLDLSKTRRNFGLEKLFS
jgi:LAGLIDADG endonuclease